MTCDHVTENLNCDICRMSRAYKAYWDMIKEFKPQLKYYEVDKK